jgi:oxygen-dependent protoporphyrinogen oxidase
MRLRYDVVVVGGGVAGLVAARELAAQGSVLVLEASPRCGGAVAGAELGGVRTDVGADSYAVTRPEAAALVAALGLEDVAVEPARSDPRLWHDGAALPMPPTLLGVPTDLGSAELVAVVGAAAAGRARDLDARPVGSYPTDVSLGTLVRERMGDAVVDRVLAPLVGGVHASDPDRVEAEAVVPGLLAALAEHGALTAAAAALRGRARATGPVVRGLRGGMSRLVEALLDDLGARGAVVATSRPVAEISRIAGGWRPADGITARRLVLAVPAVEAARLLAGVDDRLAATADRLRQVATADVAVVSLLVRSGALDAEPVGSGVLVAPTDTVVAAKALTHATAKWAWLGSAYGPGRHLLRLSYGRDGAVGHDLAALPELARRDAEVLCGAALPDVEDVRVTRWPGSLVRPVPGHRARVALIERDLEGVDGLAVVGAGLGGNGLAGTIARARAAVLR